MMSKRSEFNILISSAGRRPYLVRWFQEALVANGISGKVIVADVDETAPSVAFADEFTAAPRVNEPGYAGWLSNMLAEREIGLAVSVNDFELSVWSHLPDSEEFATLVRTSPRVQNLVEDKLAMSAELSKFGVRAPMTWLGSEVPSDRAKRFVTKGRFGSASRGLHFSDASELETTIEVATQDVTNRQGIPAGQQGEVSPRDLVVVQEEILGTEFGLDIVCDFNNNFVAALARRKLSMRGGETDRAVSVDPAPFTEIARRVAEAVPHQGTFDVDIIVDDSGTAFVIDINPRFGGGYPFSHAAGARLPDAYVAWGRGKEPPQDWFVYDHGVVAGKYVEITAIPEFKGVVS